MEEVTMEDVIMDEVTFDDVTMEEVTLNQIRQIRYLGHVFECAKYGQVGYS